MHFVLDCLQNAPTNINCYYIKKGVNTVASLSPSAIKIYQHLVTKILPAKKVTTYGDVSKATGVEIGVEGGYIGAVLGEIAHACDTHNLPPLTAIVVRADQLYDPKRRHGMPGTGYFVMRAETDPEFAEWKQKPAPAGFDKDADRWKLQSIIEAHQDSVWQHSAWPAKL